MSIESILSTAEYQDFSEADADAVLALMLNERHDSTSSVIKWERLDDVVDNAKRAVMVQVQEVVTLTSSDWGSGDPPSIDEVVRALRIRDVSRMWDSARAEAITAAMQGGSVAESNAAGLAVVTRR